MAKSQWIKAAGEALDPLNFKGRGGTPNTMRRAMLFQPLDLTSNLHRLLLRWAHVQDFAVTVMPSNLLGTSSYPVGRVSEQLGTITRLSVHPALPVLLIKNGPLGAVDSIARLNKNSSTGSNYPEGNFRGNQLLNGSISLSPLYPRILTLEAFSEGQGRSVVQPTRDLTSVRCQPRSRRRHLYKRNKCLGLGCRLNLHQSMPQVDWQTSLSPFHIRLSHITGLHSLSFRQFQALFDSLFNLLFIFPLWYLFAIGLSPIFHLKQNLPLDWVCIPKQLDSLIVPRGAAGSKRNGALTLSRAPF
ncbi:senescence-associated protein [Cucumis melo var. makuwa]|uniref:Senescence-associated protein n=1 Tax=Cucumis melo var. makuwa TaxID=1194695 RepID=A0A5A7TFP7_CUCMM|nr:senescence-associated protein [Cucumis melo var. makuwa]TYK17969.1 senescence-associated protein [Cucumis melo var. makuwa]